MRNQSKKAESISYAPIELDLEFPVSELDYTERGLDSPIPPHVHDCFEIGYCHRGTGIFLIENKVFSFKPGDAVVVNNREIHIMKSNSADAKTSWNFVNLDPVGLLGGYVTAEERSLEIETLSGPDFENIFCPERNQDICLLILEIINELKSKGDSFQSQIRALTWSLMIKLHRLRPKQRIDQKLNRKVLDRIRPSLEYIAEHYHETLELAKLARLCHTSVPNFRKLFYKAVGIAPMVYIKELRLKAAGVLLKNSKRSILDIATVSGFATLSNFNRQFRDYYKLSPREWRSVSETSETSENSENSEFYETFEFPVSITAEGDSIYRPRGGYRELRSFQVATVIYDGTVSFCDRFISKRSRTHDQMVQGARSGRQNIAEGSCAAATSAKTEIRLTNVARASLDELLLDFEDFIRQRKLLMWDKNSPEAKQVRQLGKSSKVNPVEHYAIYAPWLEHASPMISANTLICLIHQADFLLERQLSRLEKKFITEGGFSENMAKVRAENLSDKMDKKVCAICGKAMVLRLASKGANAGNHFWGCSGYPKCRSTMPLDEA